MSKFTENFALWRCMLRSKIWTRCSILILLITGFLLLAAEVPAASPDRPKIGLVLAGGGAKGIAHIGTLQLLDSLGIVPDYIAGTSMGGIAGALYAIGYSGSELEQIVTSVDWPQLFTDRPVRDELPFVIKKYDGMHQLRFEMEGFVPKIPDAMVIGQKVSLLFSDLTVEYDTVLDFDQLPIPFRCIASDLITGNEVVLRSGSLAKAMRATMSIPTVFKPVTWGDSLLIDGGMANNFPVDVVRAMGADIVIGVDVGAPLKDRAEINNVLDVFQQTMNLVGLERIAANRKNTDILIIPDIGSFSSGDFEKEKIPQILKVGKQAAASARNKLIALANQMNRYPKSQKKIAVTAVNLEKHVLHGIAISGNKRLSFRFIYNQLGVKPGEPINDLDLENRITALYALGYFETINYNIRVTEDNKAILQIEVVEKTLRELRVGFRYNDYYQLVGLASFFGTDLILPGGRMEIELSFAGMTTFGIKPSLPSRGLDMPIIPFLHYYFWDIPIPIYDTQGQKIATYKDKGNSFGGGLDVPVAKSWMLEGEFSIQYMNIKPDVALADSSIFPKFTDKIHEIILTSTIDRLDDVLIPRQGLYANLKYSGSRKNLGSVLEYDRLELMAKYYHTINKFHTFMLHGFYGWSNNIPIYKYFQIGGPDNFVGVDHVQLLAQKIAFGRLDYRYEFSKNFFLLLAGNIAFDYQYGGLRPPENNQLIGGWGVGLMFSSVLGPFEMMYSRGDKSPLNPGETQYNYYFKAGYIF